MPHRYQHLLIDAHLCTLDGETGYGLIADGALGWRDGRIAFSGPSAALPDAPERLAETVVRAEGRLVTPALIDCHTHLVFAGDRSGEFERRLRGASYAEIARAGGGILGTVAAVRAADEDDLLRQSLPRARALIAEGAATLEIKSGYGLDLDNELKMLRVARRIGERLGVSVRTSFLGAHAVPPEFAGRADAYIEEIQERMLPAVAESGLADAVDAFCEGIAFDPAQTARVLARAKALGLPVKLHADQLSDLGGGALCAGFGGLSADHLEYTTAEAAKTMADAGTVAVLLPGAFVCLGETRQPPVAAFREHGVAMAVASDCNPGSSPLLSPRLAMGLACVQFGLTPEEALRGTTRNAARALGLRDRGRLAPGLRADVALWNLSTPAELSYWLGGQPLHTLWAGGRVIASGRQSASQ